jgi:hypothetical protein
MRQHRHITRIRKLETALGRNTSFETLEPFKWKSGDNSNRALDLQTAAKRIAKFLKLEYLVFHIAFTAKPHEVAAHIELQSDSPDVFVELSSELLDFDEAVIAVLSHELTHRYLYKFGIRESNTEENEILTDVAAVYLGLGKIMLNGCHDEIIRHVQRDTGPATISHKVKVGYITREELAFVYELCGAMRNLDTKRNLAGLNSGAQESCANVRRQYEPFLDRRAHTAEHQSDFIVANLEAIVGQQRALAELDRLIRLTKTDVLDALERLSQDGHNAFAASREMLGKIAESGDHNPHLRFLDIVGWRHEAFTCDSTVLDNLTSLIVEVQRKFLINEVFEDKVQIECPLDKTKLRVPAGKQSLLVTCPACKYKFVVNSKYTVVKSEQDSSVKGIFGKAKALFGRT